MQKAKALTCVYQKYDERQQYRSSIIRTEDLSMEFSQPIVIVSSFFEDASYLAGILQRRGIRPFYTDETPWPRDRGICVDQRYFLINKNKLGGMEGIERQLEQGGMYCFGSSYGLVSTTATQHGNIPRPDISELLSSFFERKMYEIPPYETESGHLDLTCLAIRSQNRLIITKQQYELAKDTFEHVAREHNQELIIYDPQEEEELWPLNSLVLELPEGPHIIANQFTPKFLLFLCNLGLTYDKVCASKHETTSHGGSIHCATNEWVWPSPIPVLRDLRPAFP
jgi:hypothetical protein